MCNTRLISFRIPLDILEQIDSQAKTEQRSRAQVIIQRLRPRCEANGSVYVMLNPTNGLYKIGFSSNPEIRRSTLGKELEIVFTRQDVDPRACEKAIHRHFASQRVSKEWFTLNVDDLAWIERWPLFHPRKGDWESAAMSCECHLPKYALDWNRAATAQPAEQRTRNAPVVGSIPTGRSIKLSQQCADCGGMNGMHQKWCKTK